MDGAKTKCQIPVFSWIWEKEARLAFFLQFELILAAFSVEMSSFREQLQRNVSNDLTANISLVAWGVYCLRCKTLWIMFFLVASLPDCAQMHICMRKNLSMSPQSFDQPNFSLAMVSWCIIWQKPRRLHYQTADSKAFLSRSRCLSLAENLKRMQSEWVIFPHPFPVNMCMQTWLKLRYYTNNWLQMRYSFSHKLFF